MDETAYARTIAAVLAIGLAIDSAEFITLRRDFSRDGLLSWDVLRLDNRWLAHGPVATVASVLLAYPNYVVLIVAQLVLALGVVVVIGTPGMFPAPQLFGALLGIRLLSNLRHAHGGLDGSDQMQVVLLAAMTVFFATSDPLARTAALYFVAAQSMLSYLAAGAAKLISPVWRSGAGLTGILETDNYGTALVGRWLRNHTVLAVLGSWAVIGFECVGPFTTLAGVGPCLLFIAVAVMFHVSIAVLMGLNNFVWSFSAALPAVLFMAASL